MSLKSATMIGMVGLGLALVLRFVVLLMNLLQFMQVSGSGSDFPF